MVILAVRVAGAVVGVDGAGSAARQVERAMRRINAKRGAAECMVILFRRKVRTDLPRSFKVHAREGYFCSIARWRRF